VGLCGGGGDWCGRGVSGGGHGGYALARHGIDAAMREHSEDRRSEYRQTAVRIGVRYDGRVTRVSDFLLLACDGGKEYVSLPHFSNAVATSDLELDMFSAVQQRQDS
jgi:hypothetical protein